MDTETSKRRLMLLVEKLRSLPPMRFDYSQWVGEDWGGAKDLSCGTTACALGWATTIPELEQAGLCLWRANERCSAVVAMADGGRPTITDSIDSAGEAFGLEPDEAEYLFYPLSEPPSWAVDADGLDESPSEYANAAEVADHIERFVKAKFG